MRLKIVALGVEESGCSGLRPWQRVRGLLGDHPSCCSVAGVCHSLQLWRLVSGAVLSEEESVLLVIVGLPDCHRGAASDHF